MSPKSLSALLTVQSTHLRKRAAADLIISCFHRPDAVGGTAQRRWAKTWSARSCRWCWRRHGRPIPRRPCTRFRATASRSSSPTSPGWSSGWTHGGAITPIHENTSVDSCRCADTVASKALVCTCRRRVNVGLYIVWISDGIWGNLLSC